MPDKKVKIENSLDARIGGAPERGSVLLSAGAGGDMDSALLTNTASNLQKLGFQTLRWNYGYVSRNGVASSGGKLEIGEMQMALNFLQKKAQDKPVILLGKSFGARLNTYLDAGDKTIAGYAFYGLPIRGLSPKSKPRDWSHLAKLNGSVIFITGDKDRLCPLEKLVSVQAFIKKKFCSFVVSGDHSYKPRGESEAIEIMTRWFDETF